MLWFLSRRFLWYSVAAMDEVKLIIRADVASPKFMRSDGFCAASGGGGGSGVGVMVTEVEARESDSISIVSKKAEVGDVNTSQSSFWNKMEEDTELCRHTNQLCSFPSEAAPEELKFQGRNNCTLSMPSLEGKQVQRKSGKVARSIGKASRVAQIEEVTINEDDDIKEKRQTAKQRNTGNGKRGDKRNGKVMMKGKYDYSSLKAGMVSFNSAAGGAYGSKPDTYDLTMHLDELSVNELLDGSYKDLSVAKDKGKKAANSSENIIHSVRKAFSILPLHKHLQNSTEKPDYGCNQKILTCPVSSEAASAASSNAGDTRTAHLRKKEETHVNLLDFPLCQPKDILERLALPPTKDLDSLLLDAAKPTAPLKNNNSDSRGKQISQRASLPPFPWSHNSVCHGKASTDPIKFSVNKTTCQGRWVKIQNTATSLEWGSGLLADLESFPYDDSLVPLKGGPKRDPLESEIVQAASVHFTSFELGSSSTAAESIASQLPPESGCSRTCEVDAGHSPRLLAAAQTLYYMSTRSLKQHGMVRWPKKPSEKTMKACKSKSNAKSGEIFTATKPVMATDDQERRNTNEVSSYKRLRLLNKDLGRTTLTKAPINWSMPISSRPSPGKTSRDHPVVESKKYNNVHAVKQSRMMPPPPPARVSDNSSNSRQKLRKLVPVEWSMEGER